MYLIRTVRPALAISYAYVNPVVALGLGMALLNERITPVGLAGIAVIVVGVICLTVIRAPQSKETA
jgi:drug/metabolite transporter (DMT)-like permease